MAMASCESHDFPPVRACIFDMDGLLINSEDIITHSLNECLRRYARPNIPRSLRVQLMGIPKSTSSDAFHDWAKVPINRKDFDREFNAEMHRQFARCEPMPGAQQLLSNLSRAHNFATGARIELALASTTTTETYQEKSSMPETIGLLDTFASERRILGDGHRVPTGRAKPAPDIFLIALQAINATVDEKQPDIRPEECLVFEDSIIGVEAGRRAGMRVVWVPHPDVAAEWQSELSIVLAGRTGTSQLGDEWQLGQADDGWAEKIASLQHFEYSKYGIVVPSEPP